MPILNFQNLMGSPLGMAGLGLLMQPTRSYQPINPMTGIAQGMLAAGQYRQNEMQNAIQQQRAEMEQQRLQFQLEDSLRKREQEAAAQAEADRLRAAQEAYMAGRPPEEQALAAAMGLPAYMAAVGKQQFAEPSEQWSEPYVDNSTGKPLLVQRSSMTGQLRSVGSGAVEINMPGSEPLKPSDLTNLRGPNGEALPYGTTAEQAAGMGAVPVPPQTPAEKTAESLNLDKQRLKQKKAEQESIANRNLMLLKEEIAANGGLQSIVPGSPAAQKIEGFRTAAAIAMARAQSPDPNQEPNDPIVQQFREMLPGHLMGAFGVTSGIDAAQSLLGNPVSATGSIVPNQGAARINNDQEYDALPSGTKFIGPDGIERVKP